MEILGVNGEKLYSRNLGDLLRLRETDGSSSGGGRGVTLYAVLCEKTRIEAVAAPENELPPPQLERARSTRTLLDVINEERICSTVQIDARKSWRNLTDKIRLLRRGGAGGDLEPTIGNGNPSSANSEAVVVSEEIEPRPRREEPTRMSLMALLAENDRQLSSSDVRVPEEQEEEEEEPSELDRGGGGGEGYNSNYSCCCVCMLREKGAAFIPCGHTFCRRCSREVWVQRGNCPLCNNAIVEILDIF